MTSDVQRKPDGDELQPINARVPRHIAEMLRAAKRATGRSQKYLLSDAIRSKYSRYLTTQKNAA